MKTKLMIMTAVAAVLGLSATVQATPIVGSIGFTGNYSQTGGNAFTLSEATSLSITSVAISVPATTGALLGATLNSFVTPIGVNGNAPSLVGAQLWSVTVGSTIYTFDVSSAAQTLGPGNTLTLAGGGWLEDGKSADNTAGSWTLGFGASGAAFTFNNTTANNVPDGGTTVMLLGAALSGLALIKRKLVA